MFGGRKWFSVLSYDSYVIACAEQFSITYKILRYWRRYASFMAFMCWVQIFCVFQAFLCVQNKSRRWLTGLNFWGKLFCRAEDQIITRGPSKPSAYTLRTAFSLSSTNKLLLAHPWDELNEAGSTYKEVQPYLHCTNKIYPVSIRSQSNSFWWTKTSSEDSKPASPYFLELDSFSRSIKP